MNAGTHAYRAVQSIGQVAGHPGSQHIFAVSGQAHELDVMFCFLRMRGQGACNSHSAYVSLAAAAYDLQVTPQA